MSREQLIAELQRRGVPLPPGTAVEPVAPQPQFNKEALMAELQRRGVSIPTAPPPTIPTAPLPPLTLAEKIGQAITGGTADIGRGLLQGGKEFVSGTLQAGADIAGLAFPGSEGVQEFRELIPEAVSRSRQQFQAQTGGSIPGQVGEFIGQAAPFIAALPAGAATGLGRIGLGAAGGALAGATGAQEEQLTPGQALTQRAGGAALGGTIGAAIPGALGIAGRLVKGRGADKILASRIKADEAAQALGQLKEGRISVLADVAGDEIQGLTRAIGKVSGGARNIVADALEGRSEAAVKRISTALSKNISNVDTYFANIDDIVKARSAVASPLYSKAYSEAASIDRGNLNKLLQDQRIISAIDDAKANLGVRIEAPANSLEALDGAKKSLDDIIGKAMASRETQKAGSFIKLKNQLLNELDAASPTYKKARKIFSDFASLENAQKTGLDYTKQTPEQLGRLLKTLDNTQKEAFKVGVRENLQRTVSKTADQADPAKRIFGNTFKRDQLKTIFGEGKQFDQFEKVMLEEIRAAKTKFKVLGGSRTDINIADDAEFIKAITAAAHQGILSLPARGINFVVGKVAKRYDGLSSKNAKELAEILTDRSAGIERLEQLIQRTPEGAQRLLLQDASRDLGTILGVSTVAGGG